MSRVWFLLHNGIRVKECAAFFTLIFSPRTRYTESQYILSVISEGYRSCVEKREKLALDGSRSRDFEFRAHRGATTARSGELFVQYTLVCPLASKKLYSHSVQNALFTTVLHFFGARHPPRRPSLCSLIVAELYCTVDAQRCGVGTGVEEASGELKCEKPESKARIALRYICLLIPRG